MTKDLGVWTADDCALVLIDYQNENVRGHTIGDEGRLVGLHVRLLAKTAKAFGVPIVLSRWASGTASTDPRLPSHPVELDGIEADRPLLDETRSRTAFPRPWRQQGASG